MQEFIRATEQYFALLGIPLAIAYAVFLVTWLLRTRSARFREWWKRNTKPRLEAVSPRVVDSIALGILAFAAVAFAYCVLCGKPIEAKAAHDAGFFHILTSYSLKVFPYFVAGCLLSVWIARWVGDGSRWLPKSMIGAGLFASLLPICSCAAVPFSYSLMRTGKIRLRAVVTFMMVVPVLNPFVIPFSYGVLGWQYTMWRIVGAFALGMVTGIIVERVAGRVDPELPSGGCVACDGCNKGHLDLTGTGSVLSTTMRLAGQLAPYMVIGVVIGAAFTMYVPPAVVGNYLSHKFVGLILAAGIGLPIYLCSGEDVLILSPLMSMGLPMGHAIALTLAGNGICLSSIALLVPLFGKKASAIIVAAFLVGSILIGLGINAVYPLFA